MKPHHSILIGLTFAVSSSLVIAGEQHHVKFKVSAGKSDRENVPVRVTVVLPEKFKDQTVASIEDAAGGTQLGQLTAPSLLTEPPKLKGDGQIVRQLHFVVPKLAAGQSLDFNASVATDKSSSGKRFAWTDESGKHTELSFGGRPVLRYMYEALDDSRREETYKVFHHVYDPSGKQIITKGPGGRYTHHRGLFYGFNRISYEQEGKKMSADIWHCRNAHQAHGEFLSSETGPLVGQHLLAIHWHGTDKKVFAKEEREMTVYNLPGGTLIEFASQLRSVGGKITLDGDPQHAGFQFRANNDVAAKTSKQTYYLRPSGKGDLGQTINWNAKTDVHANLPWNAMSFVAGDQRYTCCYLDRPQNPKPARYSERDYGRFGSYFKYELNEDSVLALNYRVWIQQGEMTVDEVASLSSDFVSPPAVEPTK